MAIQIPYTDGFIPEPNVSNAESKDNKGVANGYAPLDVNAKVPVANLPDQASLDAEVDGKITTHNSATTSVHGIANTANLSLVGHTHAISDVTGLQTAIDNSGIKAGVQWTTRHTNSTGNPYLVGSIVYHNGRVYRCTASNDSIEPGGIDNPYWADLGVGYLLPNENPFIEGGTINTTTFYLHRDCVDETAWAWVGGPIIASEIPNYFVVLARSGSFNNKPNYDYNEGEFRIFYAGGGTQHWYLEREGGIISTAVAGDEAYPWLATWPSGTSVTKAQCPAPNAGGSINVSGGARGAGGAINISNGGGSITSQDGGGSILLNGFLGDPDNEIPHSNSGSINLSALGNENSHGGNIISNGTSGYSGGSLNMSAGLGGAGGSINTSSNEGVGGYINTSADSNGANGGFINTGSGPVGDGGSINTSNNGGSINTSGGGNGAGGSINTSNNGGSINTSGVNDVAGGSINTSGGGNINTSRGSGNDGGAGGSINLSGGDDGGDGVGGAGGSINLSGGDDDSNDGANGGSISLVGGTDGCSAGSIISNGGTGTGATGGTLNMSGGSDVSGGNINTSGGGSINTSGNGGSINTSGNPAGSSGGSINLSATNDDGNNGGSIISTGGSGGGIVGGTLDMSGGEFSGGSINTSNGGGSINTAGGGAGGGGSINLSNGGGSITSVGEYDVPGGSINLSYAMVDGDPYSGGNINTSGGGSINTSNLGGSINTSGYDANAGGSINLSATEFGSGGFIDGKNKGGFIKFYGTGPTSSGGSINISAGAHTNHGQSYPSEFSGLGGNGGSIQLLGGNGGEENNAGNGGNGGTILGDGGGAITVGQNAQGEAILATGHNGGTINFSAGYNGAGGNINISDGGGSINTRGVGSIQLGVTGTRTTLNGSASGSDKTITLPNASGTIALTSDVRFGSQTIFTLGGEAKTTFALGTSYLYGCMPTRGPMTTAGGTGSYLNAVLKVLGNFTVTGISVHQYLPSLTGATLTYQLVRVLDASTTQALGSSIVVAGNNNLTTSASSISASLNSGDHIGLMLTLGASGTVPVATAATTILANIYCVPR